MTSFINYWFGKLVDINTKFIIFSLLKHNRKIYIEWDAIFNI